MNPYQIQANDVQALMTEQGASCPSFVWDKDKKTYLILPGSAMLNKELRDGGFSAAYDLTFVVLVGQFTAANVSALKDMIINSGVTYLGIYYKAKTVDILTGETMLRINCNAFNQKA